MIRRLRLLRVRSVWTALLSAAFASALASAAAASSFSTQASITLDQSATTPGCNLSNDNGISVCQTIDPYHTDVADGYASSAASEDNGHLHAHADVTATNSSDLHSNQATTFFEESASAVVVFNDRITFTNPSQFAASPQGIVRLTLTVNGATTRGGSGYAILRMDNFGSPYPGGCSNFTLPGSCTGGGQVYFAAGMGFDITLDAAAIASMDTSMENSQGIIPAGTTVIANADFGDTAYISAVEILDLAGNPLALDYVSESGAIYPGTEAPEPAGVGLFAVAGVALGLARRLRASH